MRLVCQLPHGLHVCFVQIKHTDWRACVPTYRVVRMFGRSHYERVCSTCVNAKSRDRKKKQHTRNQSNRFVEHIRTSTSTLCRRKHAIKSTAYCLNYSTCSIFRRNYKICNHFRSQLPAHGLTTTTRATWFQLLPISGHNVNAHSGDVLTQHPSFRIQIRNHSGVWVFPFGYIPCVVRFMNEKRIQTKWKSFHISRRLPMARCTVHSAIKCPRMDKLFPNYFRRYQLTAFLPRSSFSLEYVLFLFFFLSPRAAAKYLPGIQHQHPLGQT